MKKSYFSLLGALSILLLLAFTPTSKEPSFVHVFPVDGQAALELQTSGGSIEVHKGDENEVMVEFIVSKKGKVIDMTLDDLRIQKEVTIVHAGNRIVIKVKNRSGAKNNNLSVSFVAHVPEKTSSEVRTSGGHLNVSGLIGTQKLVTSGGHIDIQDLKGNIESQTSGGMINGKDLMGIIKVGTSGGHINITHLKGVLEANTSGGHIALERISGSASAKTSGGHISVDFDEIDGDGSFVTSGGNVSVDVPDGQGLNVKLHGSSVEMDLGSFSGERKRNMVKGSVNGGGYALSCQTSGGKVSLY